MILVLSRQLRWIAWPSTRENPQRSPMQSRASPIHPALEEAQADVKNGPAQAEIEQEPAIIQHKAECESRATCNLAPASARRPIALPTLVAWLVTPDAHKPHNRFFHADFLFIWRTRAR